MDTESMPMLASHGYIHFCSWVCFHSSLKNILIFVKTQSISMACKINCKLKICITKNLIAHWCGFHLENNIHTMYTAIPFVEHKRWTLRRIFSAIVYRISKLSNVSSDIFRLLEFAIIVKITNLMWTISLNNAHYWNRWFLWARLFGKRTHIRCHLHA